MATGTIDVYDHYAHEDDYPDLDVAGAGMTGGIGQAFLHDAVQSHGYVAVECRDICVCRKLHRDAEPFLKVGDIFPHGCRKAEIVQRGWPQFHRHVADIQPQIGRYVARVEQ